MHIVDKKLLFNQYTINDHIQRVDEISSIVKSIESENDEVDNIPKLLSLNDEVKILSDGILNFYLKY